MIRSNPFQIFSGIETVPADLHAKDSGWLFLPRALDAAEVDSLTIDEIERYLVGALLADDDRRVEIALRDISSELETPVTKVLVEGRGHMDGGREWMVYVHA